MIAKLICRAPTREECITKMERALDEFIIEGVKTTVPFHQRLMKTKTLEKGISIPVSSTISTWKNKA
jgi:acetyl-CoA carboxylase biotin carboxylase subunit